MPVDPVSNENLRLTDVPTRDADWQEIVAFANTVPEPDPTIDHGEVVSRYHDTGFWQGTLSELRGRLYQECLEFHNHGIDPTEPDMERIHDLLDAIRLKVKAGDRG
jgi:hypothetical protein